MKAIFDTWEVHSVEGWNLISEEKKGELIYVLMYLLSCLPDFALVKFTEIRFSVY